MMGVIRVLVVFGGFAWTLMGFGAAHSAWTAPGNVEAGIGAQLLMTGGMVGFWLAVTTLFCGFVLGPVWSGEVFE